MASPLIHGDFPLFRTAMAQDKQAPFSPAISSTRVLAMGQDKQLFFSTASPLSTGIFATAQVELLPFLDNKPSTHGDLCPGQAAPPSRQPVPYPRGSLPWLGLSSPSFLKAINLETSACRFPGVIAASTILQFSPSTATVFFKQTLQQPSHPHKAHRRKPHYFHPRSFVPRCRPSCRHSRSTAISRAQRQSQSVL